MDDRAFSPEDEASIISLAQANPTWGYLRIQMTLAHLGIKVSFMTVKRIMNNNGFFPPPDGRVNNDINLFYEAHRNIVAACDFCTYELLTPHGVERRHILFFEDITTREVWCGAITEEPDANYMAQVARNQLDCFEGNLRNMKYLIHDNAMVSEVVSPRCCHLPVAPQNESGLSARNRTDTWSLSSRRSRQNASTASS